MKGILILAFALGVGFGAWPGRARGWLAAVTWATLATLLVVGGGYTAVYLTEVAAGVSERGLAGVSGEAAGVVVFLVFGLLWLGTCAIGPAAAGAVVGVTGRTAVRFWVSPRGE